jgi:hypothetical protein
MYAAAKLCGLSPNLFTVIGRQTQKRFHVPQFADQTFGACCKTIRDRQDRGDIAFYVKVIVKICLTDAKLGSRPEHSAQRSRMPEDDGKLGILAWLRAPSRAIPQSDGKVAGLMVGEELLKEA